MLWALISGLGMSVRERQQGRSLSIHRVRDRREYLIFLPKIASAAVHCPHFVDLPETTLLPKPSRCIRFEVGQDSVNRHVCMNNAVDVRRSDVQREESPVSVSTNLDDRILNSRASSFVQCDRRLHHPISSYRTPRRTGRSERLSIDNMFPINRTLVLAMQPCAVRVPRQEVRKRVAHGTLPFEYQLHIQSDNQSPER